MINREEENKLSMNNNIEKIISDLKESQKESKQFYKENKKEQKAFNKENEEINSSLHKLFNSI